MSETLGPSPEEMGLNRAKEELAKRQNSLSENEEREREAQEELDGATEELNRTEQVEEPLYVVRDRRALPNTENPKTEIEPENTENENPIERAYNELNERRKVLEGELRDLQEQRKLLTAELGSFSRMVSYLEGEAKAIKSQIDTARRQRNALKLIPFGPVGRLSQEIARQEEALEQYRDPLVTPKDIETRKKSPYMGIGRKIEKEIERLKDEREQRRIEARENIENDPEIKRIEETIASHEANLDAYMNGRAREQHSSFLEKFKTKLLGRKKGSNRNEPENKSGEIDTTVLQERERQELDKKHEEQRAGFLTRIAEKFKERKPLVAAAVLGLVTGMIFGVGRNVDRDGNTGKTTSLKTQRIPSSIPDKSVLNGHEEPTGRIWTPPRQPANQMREWVNERGGPVDVTINKENRNGPGSLGHVNIDTSPKARANEIPTVAEEIASTEINPQLTSVIIEEAGKMGIDTNRVRDQLKISNSDLSDNAIRLYEQYNSDKRDQSDIFWDWGSKQNGTYFKTTDPAVAAAHFALGQAFSDNPTGQY